MVSTAAIAIKNFFNYIGSMLHFDASKFLDLKSNLNFNNQTLFIGLGLLMILLYGLSLGRTRSVISLLGIYVAFAFDRLFPYFEELKNLIKSPVDDYVLRITLFSIVYLIVFAIFNYSFIKKRFSSADFSIISVLVISFLQIGFLTSILVSFLPNEMALKFLGPFYSYLATQKAMFFWSLAPIPAILLVGR